MPYLDHLTEEAGRTGAVNTLFWRDGELCGENTDVAGFIAPLKRRQRPPESALILGAGGASLACIHGLRLWGVSRISVAARRREALAELQRKRGIAPVAWEERGEVQADLLINATPVGMRGKMEDASPMPVEWLRRSQTVYDLIYNPVETTLLREAAAAGCDTVSGLEMFVEQGRAQFELWTGRSFDPDKARRLLLERLQQ
jgi:shikimate dehydrogenase